MNIREFKTMATFAGKFYDNTPAAAEAWARSWGLTFHSLLWRYKEYEYENVRIKQGKIHHRHGSYSHEEYYVDGEQVSRAKAMKAIASMEYKPELIKCPDQEVKAKPRMRTKDSSSGQLPLF